MVEKGGRAVPLWRRGEGQSPYGEGGKGGPPMEKGGRAVPLWRHSIAPIDKATLATLWALQMCHIIIMRESLEWPQLNVLIFDPLSECNKHVSPHQ